MNSDPGIPKMETISKVPRIYELASENANADELSRQMYMDYFAERDLEKVYLGLRALYARGPEGRAQIRMMASGSDELSRLLKTIQDEDLSGIDAEKVLGISRFGTVVSVEEGKEHQEEFFQLCDRHLEHVKRPSGAENLMHRWNDEVYSLINTREKGEQAPQLSGKIEDFQFNMNFTFGVHESEYLEQLGPEEILRIRTMERPRMLLIGSLGVYSAREFHEYAHKLNASSETQVLEINPILTSMLRNDRSVDNTVIEGDAREMPLEAESVDYIYTDNLFHFLRDKDRKDVASLAEIRKVFKEAFRILKPGGSFIVIEQPYGEEVSGDQERVAQEMRTTGSFVGFSKINVNLDCASYLFREENVSAVIDENGFPHYEHCAIRKDKGFLTSCRFVK